MQTAKKEAAREFTQYQLSTKIITKLNTFNLTPTAKLVLLYLTTCYNPKHKEVFPKQRTIADKIGVSERSVTRAIQELFNEGLILVECKYTNRYKFTSRIIQEQPVNLSDDLRQNDIQKDDKLSDSYIEQIKETKKEQTGLNKGGNVYWTSEQSARAERRHVYCERSLTEEDRILEEYAIKHGARNVKAYVNTLKSTKSAEKIIKEYKRTGTPYKTFEQTKNLLAEYKEFEQNAESPQNCSAWVVLGKKLGIQKKLN